MTILFQNTEELIWEANNNTVKEKEYDKRMYKLNSLIISRTLLDTLEKKRKNNYKHRTEAFTRSQFTFQKKTEKKVNFHLPLEEIF